MEYFASHPTLDMIELYLLDRIHHQDKQVLADHLVICRACQTMTERLQEQIELIHESMMAA